MNIALAVTGSISCYKSYDLLRTLIREGHTIKIILTQGALEFIKPQMFRYLGAKAVYCHNDDFQYPQGEGNAPILHISLARWADKLVIVPLSANTASRLASARSDDLLTSLFLAFEPTKPILIFPAMNSFMLEHPFTQDAFASLQKIKSLANVFIHPTDEGTLACEEHGKGKLPSVEEVSDLIETIESTKTDKKVLIAAGATISPIDPVRYVTNPSSGITGYRFAKECLKSGHCVVAVVGHYSTNKFTLLKNHPQFRLITIMTTKEMSGFIESEFPKCDIYITPAAIADLEFDMYKYKIKKSSLSHHLKFKSSPDILATVIEKKQRQFIVGFAAETNLTKKTMKEKFNRKPVDILIGTDVFHDSSKIAGFQKEEANYIIFDGKTFTTNKMTKASLARFILDRIRTHYNP